MKKMFAQYIGIYFTSYMAIGALMPLIGQYLDFIGFSGNKIGTITAAGTAVAIIAVTFWGDRYNRSRNHRVILVMLTIGAALCSGMLSCVSAYIFVLAIYGTMYFFQSPVMGLVDAMCMEDRQPFGKARTWGCVGYAVGVFAAGRLADAFGLPMIFRIYIFGFLLSALLVAMMIRSCRNSDGGRRERKEKKKARQYGLLLHNKPYICLLFSAFFLLGTNVANNTYFGFLYTECGGTLTGLGTAMFLMVISEAPVMAISQKLSDRFGMEKILLASMVVSVCRFAWYATLPPYFLLLASFFLQGMVNGIILVEFIRYIDRLVPAEVFGMAVSVYYAFASNVSTILCQLLGGILLEERGAAGIYLLFAVYNLTGLFLYICFGLYRNGQGEKKRKKFEKGVDK